MKSERFSPLASLVMAVLLTFGLAACGGSSDEMPEPDGPTLAERQAAQQGAIDTASAGVTTALSNLNSSMPTPAQVAALNTAITALDDAIKAAVDLSDSVRGTANGQLSFARNAAMSAQTSIDRTDKYARAADQQTAIDTASTDVGNAMDMLSDPLPTQDQVDALDTAIMDLQAAIEAAVDVEDLSDANTLLSDARNRKMMAQTDVTTALNTRRSNQMGAIDLAMNFVTVAMKNLEEAGTATPELVAALESAISRLEGAVNGADDLSESETSDANMQLASARSELMMARGDVDGAKGKREDDQRHRLSGATSGVEDALNALGDNLPTQEQADALDTAIEALQAAIGAAADLGDEELATAKLLVVSARLVHTQAESDIKADADAKALVARKEMNRLAGEVAVAVSAAANHLDTMPGEEFAKRSPAFNAGDSGTDFGVSNVFGDVKFMLNQTAEEKEDKGYKESDAPMVGEDFTGKMYKYNSGGVRPVTEMAAVYTDIEENKDADWSADNFAGSGIEVDTGSSSATRYTVTFSGPNSTPVNRIGGDRILPSEPEKDEESTKKFMTSGEGGVAIRGSFYGEEGVYRCEVGTECSVTRTTAENVTFSNFTFDPDADSPKARNVDADMDYTLFGYWMKSARQRDNADGKPVMVHEVAAFHSGMGVLGGGTYLAEVEGTAKYYGAAAGVYVKKEGVGDSREVTHGMFTADAMLTANFIGDDIPVNEHRTVSGTISGFMDGSTDLGFAALTLGPADIDPSGTAGAILEAETNGGGTSGKWEGRFYGNANPGNDNAEGSEEDRGNDFPTDVSGEFSGHFSNGDVVGAFGAKRDE